jgi:hypothetical protein
MAITAGVGPAHHRGTHRAEERALQKND